MGAVVHPRLEQAIAICIASDPDQSVKQNLFGVEILDAPSTWTPPNPMNRTEFDLAVTEALQNVERIWINLNLRAVTKERRILVLEYFTKPYDPDFVRPPAEHIHINPSGLPTHPEYRSYPH